MKSDTWQVQLHRGRYRKLRQVPPIHLRRGVLSDGSYVPGKSPYPKAKMDRGRLNVAVLAYSRVSGIEYEQGHKVLSRGMEKSGSITGVVAAGGEPYPLANNIEG